MYVHRSNCPSVPPIILSQTASCPPFPPNFPPLLLLSSAPGEGKLRAISFAPHALQLFPVFAFPLCTPILPGRETAQNDLKAFLTSLSHFPPQFPASSPQLGAGRGKLLAAHATWTQELLDIFYTLFIFCRFAFFPLHLFFWFFWELPKKI